MELWTRARSGFPVVTVEVGERLSLRHWDTGQHGVWGGLVPAERAALRRRLPSREQG